MESAKRRVPVVKPVTHEGIRYETLRRAREHGFAQAGGVITATNVASGAQLWTRQLYETAFDPDEERDVQEIYITTLKLDLKTSTLLVTDERKRRWRVDLADGHSEPMEDEKGRAAEPR